MAIPRKDALRRLQGYVDRVELHLRIIASDPEDRAVSHHRHEVWVWLATMEEAARHVGKKTGAEWQARIAAYRAALAT
jgi:hypothetical protein